MYRVHIYISYVYRITCTLRHEIKKAYMVNILSWKLISQWCVYRCTYIPSINSVSASWAGPRRDVGTKRYRTHLFSLQAYRDGPMYNWPVRVRNCRVFEKKRETEKEKWSGRIKQENREPGRKVHSTLYFRIIGRANRNWTESMTCLPLRAHRAARIFIYLSLAHISADFARTARLRI